MSWVDLLTPEHLEGAGGGALLTFLALIPRLWRPVKRGLSALFNRRTALRLLREDLRRHLTEDMAALEELRRKADEGREATRALEGKLDGHFDRLYNRLREDFRNVHERVDDLYRLNRQPQHGD